LDICKKNNVMTIVEYTKLSEEKKVNAVMLWAILIDNYTEGEKETRVYFMDGFFIEISVENGKVVENLPYKRGFKVNKQLLHEAEKKYAVLELAA